jgi:hypothetical protein
MNHHLQLETVIFFLEISLKYQSLLLSKCYLLDILKDLHFQEYFLFFILVKT